jgi:DNA-binding response OmpR family regulator
MADLLIIDDTPETCDLLARMFARLGHAAACLHDGGAAVAALSSRRFDLVILDVMMPGTDGFDVLTAVRAAPDAAVRDTPVVLYSAISDPDVIQRALSLGADDWIIKGMPFPMMHKRVERFLAAANGDADAHAAAPAQPDA